jgi:hypothetical protein
VTEQRGTLLVHRLRRDRAAVRIQEPCRAAGLRAGDGHLLDAAVCLERRRRVGTGARRDDPDE